MTEVERSIEFEIQKDETSRKEIPEPRHIIFEAKSGVYFGKGQTL
jgi:hypothetical protein